MESDTLRVLVFENGELLRQTAELIGGLTPEEYACHHDALGCSSIGKHVRHITDHYEALLRGRALVDYDDRLRHTAVERYPQTGRQRLRDVGRHLWAWAGAVHEAMQPISVRYTADGQYQGATLVLASSTCRELAFLSNHTLHHMAIIGILARNLGIHPEEHFGVARSTQRFIAEQRETAEAGNYIAAES